MYKVQGLRVQRFKRPKIEHSETTLRHSAVRYSIFCSSLFIQAIEVGNPIIKKPCHFGLVSHEMFKSLGISIENFGIHGNAQTVSNC